MQIYGSLDNYYKNHVWAHRHRHRINKEKMLNYPVHGVTGKPSTVYGEDRMYPKNCGDIKRLNPNARSGRYYIYPNLESNAEGSVNGQSPYTPRHPFSPEYEIPEALDFVEENSRRLLQPMQGINVWCAMQLEGKNLLERNPLQSRKKSQ